VGEVAHGGCSIVMFGWALRYFALVVVVGIGFAWFQGSGGLERLNEAPAARVTASAPHATASSEAWQYVVDAGPQGHFVIEAEVNGVPVTFLVDTGASEIVLTTADAGRLGFDPHRLEFSQRFRTANGEVRGAPVKLRELRVGQFSLYDLDASVNAAPLPVSLLGMSFLQRLHGYRVEDRRLILEW
jgi:aspartyl protease family protein